jgi:hypothetical protein
VISVDCSYAPGWKWCSVFAEQVRAAASAVAAQFQAHYCLEQHFCNRTETLIDWIENANYGKEYPNHKLPIAACQQEDAPSSSLAGGGGAGGGGARGESVSAALCAACERVLTVRLQLNHCVPGNAQHGFETMQAGSLQERVRNRTALLLSRGLVARRSPDGSPCPLSLRLAHHHSLSLPISLLCCVCGGCACSVYTCAIRSVCTSSSCWRSFGRACARVWAAAAISCVTSPTPNTNGCPTSLTRYRRAYPRSWHAMDGWARTNCKRSRTAHSAMDSFRTERTD